MRSGQEELKRARGHRCHDVDANVGIDNSQEYLYWRLVPNIDGSIGMNMNVNGSLDIVANSSIDVDIDIYVNAKYKCQY